MLRNSKVDPPLQFNFVATNIYCFAFDSQGVLEKERGLEDLNGIPELSECSFGATLYTILLLSIVFKVRFSLVWAFMPAH